MEQKKWSFNEAMLGADGRSSAVTPAALLTLVVGLFNFTVIVWVCLFAKDKEYVALYITLATLAVGVIGFAAGVLFGKNVTNGKLANILATLPDNKVSSSIKTAVTEITTSSNNDDKKDG